MANDKKVSGIRAIDYLARKCDGKSETDLKNLFAYMSKIAVGSIIKDDMEYGGKKYLGIGTHQPNSSNLSALFESDNGLLKLLGTSSRGTFDPINNRGMKRLLNEFVPEYKAEQDAARAERDAKQAELKKQEEERLAKEKAEEEKKRSEVHKNGNVEYNVIYNHSHGDSHSIYGYDSLTIKVVNDATKEDVEKAFGGGLTEISSGRDNTYTITYYRD